MIICQVIGHVWATKKEEKLSGLKLMVVQEVETTEKTAPYSLQRTGRAPALANGCSLLWRQTARRAVGEDDTPVDCAIVGIIDSLEVDRETEQKKRR